MPPSTDEALLRLLQLASPALPVGAFAYSQGLEYAIHAGWVRDEAGARDWILGLLAHTLSALDAPVLARLYHAWQAEDPAAVRRWSDFLRASRESKELLAQERQMGTALARLLTDLDIPEADASVDETSACFAAMFALAAVRWRIPMNDTVFGYLWTWCENQVAAAVKLVPLGQTAGQRILSRAVAAIPEAAARGLALADDDIGGSAPGLAIAGSRHETQYSRLFRS
jgi:urease accessory protein